jgi:ABC-2 type transport system permease protein
MNTQANAMAGPPLGVPLRAPAKISWMEGFYWSVRREVWENRSIYLAPLGAAAVFVIGFMFRLPHLPAQIRAAMTLEPMKQHDALAIPYDIVAGLLMVTIMIVAAFYCVDALYGERRDRSTLFWKSLPVSDTMTVLAKASVPFIILPLVAFAITMVAELLMLLLSCVVVAASGMSVTALWTHLSFARMTLLLLYHLVMVHGVWYWPLFAWLLLVSAWARRAPFIWAFVPPVALCYLEKIALNTTHFWALLEERLSGNGMDAITASGTFPMDPMTQLTPGRYLASSGLWIGLGLTAVFLALAVRLRRARGPI